MDNHTAPQPATTFATKVDGLIVQLLDLIGRLRITRCSLIRKETAIALMYKGLALAEDCKALKVGPRATTAGLDLCDVLDALAAEVSDIESEVARLN